MNKFFEKVKTTLGFKPQDVDTSDVTSAFVSMADHRGIAAVVSLVGPTAGKILTLQLKQATDAGGTAAKNLGDAVTFTAVSTEDLAGYVEAFVEQMDVDNGFLFAGVTVGCNKGSSVLGSAVLLQFMGRYSQ